MTDRPEAAVIGENVRHIARGCRAHTSHDPTLYVLEIDDQLTVLVAALDQAEKERDGEHWLRAELAAIELERDEWMARADRAEKAVRGDSVRRHLRFLFESFSDVPPAVKVLKIAEELGEATEALIGSQRLNPRKLDRPTPTRADVAKELADVTVTAMIALHEFSDEPVQTVTNRLREVAERAGYVLAAVEGVSEPETRVPPGGDSDRSESARVGNSGSLTVLERLEQLEHNVW